MKLKFQNKDGLIDTPFQGIENLFLNTHCGDQTIDTRSKYGRMLHEAAALREGFVYRLQEVLQIPGPSTKTTRVTYLDNENNELPPMTRNVLLVEDFNNVAARQGFVLAKEIDDNEMPEFEGVDGIEKMDIFEIAKIFFFEEMIGNADWNFPIKHGPKTWYEGGPATYYGFWNVAIMIDNAGNRHIVIPYDYDVSLAVAAGKSHNLVGEPKNYPNYGFTPNDYPFKQRLLSKLQLNRSLFTRPILDRTIAYFLEKREEIETALEKWVFDPNDTDIRTIIQTRFQWFYSLISQDKFYIPVFLTEEVQPVATAGTCYLNIDKGVPVQIVENNVGDNQTRVNILDIYSKLRECAFAPVLIPSSTLLGSDYP